MNEKDPSMDLPPEIACIHRKWDVRLVAYRTLISHFQKLHPSSDEWGIYKHVISNIAAESCPTIREQALEVVFHFVQKCDTAQKMSPEVIHSLLNTIPTNIKPRAKHLLEQILLQYVEIGCSRDVIDELLRTALINQAPNVATTCINIITKILSVFGPTSIDLSYVLETLPYLQEAEEIEFRSATKALILEIYRWQGKESIKNVGHILNPADLKEVLKKYEDTKPATQMKPSRQVRNNKPTENDFSRSENQSLDQETDLLKQINEEFFRRLESPEWTERRDALSELRDILDNCYRLRPGNYELLLAALKKIVTEDQCVIVVGLAIACITGIAKGLQQQFSPYAVPICRILLEKFVEKRQNITEQLRKGLDVLTNTTSFESLIKTINFFLDNRNPTVRFETIQLLSRMFKKTTRHTLRKPEFAVLYKSLVDCLHHGQLIIREKSFIALAVAFKVAGEGVIMPYLENVEPAIRIRLKNYNLDQDFEEKYNEIKYRNVAKKELKCDDKSNARKDDSSDCNTKGFENMEEEIFQASRNFKNNNQNSLFMNQNRKRLKTMKKRENQPTFNYNKVTKRWGAYNSNVTLEDLCINPTSENLMECTVISNSPLKDCRKKDILKRYPYRKPYTVQRKDFNHCFSKDKRRKKRILSNRVSDNHREIMEEVVEYSNQIGDNVMMDHTTNSKNSVILRSEHSNHKSYLEYHSENNKKTESMVNCTNMNSSTFTMMPNVAKLNLLDSKDIIKAENASSASTQLSESSQPVQQSAQTLNSSKCGEGFIVLTENEVKKLLGLKRISAMNDDSCCILTDWNSKKNLFKRSYKIFQVSKGATDRETQTSVTAEESAAEIAPEGGDLDLTKKFDTAVGVGVISTQTAGVSIEEKGTDAHRVKKYNRGTQWVQNAETNKTSWPKEEKCSDKSKIKKNKATECQHKKKEAPLKVESVVMKQIEYRRPSVKDIRRQWEGSDKIPLADHSSKRTMEINTYTVTRSDPVDIAKNTSESLTSEVITATRERIKTKPHEERKRNHGNHGSKHSKRPKHTFSKTHNSGNLGSKTSNPSKHIKKIKRKYTREIHTHTVRSNKKTDENGEDDISSETLIRLKKVEHSKHRSLTKAASRRNASKSQVYMSFTSHKSDVSIRSGNKKERRSTCTNKNSKLKYENSNDTSSGSCREGCNLLPLMAKTIMGHNVEKREKNSHHCRKKQHKHRSQWNTKRGNRSYSIEGDQKKSEHKRSSRKCYPSGDKEPGLNLMTDAQEMDPRTKQLVINELLKVCDISQATFEKMIRRKLSPNRPCLFAPKTVLQRANDLAMSPDVDTSPEERCSREHKNCTII